MDTKGLQLSKSEMLHSDNEASSVFSREWQTLALGFTEGLLRSGSTTASDLKQTAKDFSESPIATSSLFLKNHWGDAVAGAALTFLNPTKLANAALLAYSLRGAAYQTYDTFIGALDPQADLNKLKNNYANGISEQGTAFLSSMPLAMLGGNFGRAGANAVFGKNLGAIDMLSGRVSLSEVKERLWNIHDQINPPAVKLVVTDMDNTLASHGHYFAEGVKKGIADLSVKTNIPEQELYSSIGQQMENYRSHDYPWSLEIALKDRLKVGEAGSMSAAEFEKNIVKPFWDTIDQSLKDNHKPFPTVVETLEELKNRKIPVVVLSDAPAFVGLERLVNLGLDRGLVERFYGLHNWTEPKGLSKDLLGLGHQRVETLLNTPNGLKEFRALPGQWEKPNTNGFEALMREYGVRPKETLMIGDSRVKDVGVAHNAGARGIWAEYGNPGAADEAVLTRLRPLPENSGGVGASAVSPGAKKYAPYLEAATSYDRLLAHLNPKANYLELASNAARSLSLRPELKTTIAAYAFNQPEAQK